MRSVRPSTMGASASPARRGYLNDVAAGVGTDLRLDGGRVVDTGSNLNDDETVPTTTVYTTPTPSEPAEPDESPAGTVQPSDTETPVGRRLSFRVQDTSGNDRRVESLEWDLGDGTNASGGTSPTATTPLESIR